MADDVFVLSNKFDLYIPTQCRCGEKVPESLRKTVLDSAKKQMAQWFGGVTSSDAQGGWVLQSGELAEEAVTIIYSNVSDSQKEEYLDRFIALAQSIADEMAQEAIAYAINNKMSFTMGDAGKPCLHQKTSGLKKFHPLHADVAWMLSLEATLRALCHNPQDQYQPAVKERVRDLLCHALGYSYADETVHLTDKEGKLQPLFIAGARPRVVAQGGDAFKVILIQLKDERLLLTEQRQIIDRILKNNIGLRALFVITDRKGSQWHLVNVPENSGSDRLILRRFRIEYAGQPMRTLVERLAYISLIEAPDTISDNTIKEAHDRAFDVQQVTEAFYRDYKRIFDSLQADLFRQTKDKIWAHDYTLQFLNRIMFIYFIQKKRWLNNDPEFFNNFWYEYKFSNQPEDSFVKNWLHILFYEAFNNIFSNNFPYMSEGVRKAMAEAPYLNGGLFVRNELDEKHALKCRINDAAIEQILRFLQGYNFTIGEDTPLDQEVAVDAEMLGNVYESLVNVAEINADESAVDSKKASGIFYTPRIEIDLMCRLAIVDFLANHLGDPHKPLIYDFVFTVSEEEKKIVEKLLTEKNLWIDIDSLLQNISVVDPACGSGAFLIGMLQVLDELLRRTGFAVGREETPYERKQQIIGRSLYGVDVMPWAVDIAELRLWLQLVVETELSAPERKLKPLLPNLNFKIRQGDSLIQMVGNIDFSYMRGFSSLSASLKGRLRELKGDKLRFFNNQFQNKQQSRDAIDKKERDLFQDILLERQHDTANRLKDLRSAIKPVRMLDGSRECPLSPKDAREVESEIAALESEEKQLSEALRSLRKTKTTPFVWDIAFVEIFEDSKKGFDIVVGNPPYVRQECIADPLLPQEKQNSAENKKYKEKLIRSVYALWPSFFGVNPEKPDRKLDQKNDLYCYFFFHGLALLNAKGSFAFITSNSWLDVGFGKDLQEFLITQGHVKMIIDNESRRSFKSADVNTVITLLGVPLKQQKTSFRNKARFVMFKEPFEKLNLLETFKAAEKAQERQSLPQCRIFPMTHQALWEQGSDAADTESHAKTKGKAASDNLLHSAKYIGNKWGGKYLRAPDIYWTLLEKGKDKLIPLGSVAEVRFGIKTGANDFFYLDQQAVDQWGIEKEFLKPVILSPRECPGTVVTKSTLNFSGFFCNKRKEELVGTNALRYVEWGEKQGFQNRPSCRTRQIWYALPSKKWARVLWPMIHNDRLGVYWNKSRLAVDHNLFEITGDNDYVIWGGLAWTGQVLFRELHGRANLGQGALKTEGIDIKTLYALKYSDKVLTDAFRQALLDLSDHSIDNVADEVKKPERIKLDNIVFDYLQLTQGECDAVYEAAIDLITLRLQKASSLSP